MATSEIIFKTRAETTGTYTVTVPRGCRIRVLRPALFNHVTDIVEAIVNEVSEETDEALEATIHTVMAEALDISLDELDAYDWAPFGLPLFEAEEADGPYECVPFVDQRNAGCGWTRQMRVNFRTPDGYALYACTQSKHIADDEMDVVQNMLIGLSNAFEGITDAFPAGSWVNGTESHVRLSALVRMLCSCVMAYRHGKRFNTRTSPDLKQHDDIVGLYWVTLGNIRSYIDDTN